MALALKSTALLLAAMAAAALPRAALALGPAAPFAPPRVAAAPVAAASAASAASAAADPSAAAGGLGGVHLGLRPTALIDGEWRQVGETVRGATVLAIDAQGARLAHADGRIEQLSLVPADALRRRPQDPTTHPKAIAP
jgi:hypothetical protein